LPRIFGDFYCSLIDVRIKIIMEENMKLLKFPEMPSFPVYAIRNNGFEQWHKLTEKYGVILRKNHDYPNGLFVIFAKFHGKILYPIGINESWQHNLKSPVFEDIKPNDLENILLVTQQRLSQR
jgi:hypothetical protein